MADPCNKTTEATTLEELAQQVRAFVRWVAANEFTDPENIFTCAEWFNLTGAVGERFVQAGELYRQRAKEVLNV